MTSSQSLLMLLPVRHTTARRIPGRFIKVSMVLEEQLFYLVLAPSKELGVSGPSLCRKQM